MNSVHSIVVRLPSVVVLALVTACGPSVATVVMEPAEATITKKDEVVVIKASPKDKEGNIVVDALMNMQWASSDPGVATVGKDGKVTALKSGETTISAIAGKQTGTAKVTVQFPTSIALEPPTAELTSVGQTVVLAPKVKDERGKDMPSMNIIWSTSDADVAAVEEGTVKATGQGSAVISATVQGLKADATITVKLPPAAKVTIDPGTHEFAAAQESKQFTASITDDKGSVIQGYKVVWTSSDEAVAIVQQNGTVTAVKKGKAKIKAAAGDKADEAEITVKQ